MAETMLAPHGDMRPQRPGESSAPSRGKPTYATPSPTPSSRSCYKRQIRSHTRLPERKRTRMSKQSKKKKTKENEEGKKVKVKGSVVK